HALRRDLRRQLPDRGRLHDGPHRLRGRGDEPARHPHPRPHAGDHRRRHRPRRRRGGRHRRGQGAGGLHHVRRDGPPPGPLPVADPAARLHLRPPRARPALAHLGSGDLPGAVRAPHRRHGQAGGGVAAVARPAGEGRQGGHRRGLASRHARLHQRPAGPHDRLGRLPRQLGSRHGGGGTPPRRRVRQLACSASFSSMPVPWRATASTAPVCELRRNSSPLRPASSLAFTTAPSGRLTFVPAVTYRPASTTQSSPSEMPMPAFAPIKQRSPAETTSLPPPESVPMMDAPPPRSEPSPRTTPAEILPSTIEAPSVPALKLTKPSCITVVPLDRWAPRRTRSASAIRTPDGTT